jgi:ParB family chromosome partitioning protein
LSRLRSIPIAQLKEPTRPTRASIDEAALEELAASIREVGVIEPLIVFPAENGLFEIGAGHRRFLASKIAGLQAVPCVVRADTQSTITVRIHENMGRVDLTPVDEAVFYAELFEDLGQDVDAVAAAVKRPREHVERRLILLQGDKDVLAALEAGRIVLGVAEEFNRMTRPEDRAYYLDSAMRSGCSIRQAREWRGQANAMAASRAALEQGQPPPPPTSGAGEAAAPAGPSYGHLAPVHELSSSRELRSCMFCTDEHEEWRMYKKHVCAPCADRHLVSDALARPAGTAH